jgi:hypothetical protein
MRARAASPNFTSHGIESRFFTGTKSENNVVLYGKFAFQLSSPFSWDSDLQRRSIANLALFRRLIFDESATPDSAFGTNVSTHSAKFWTPPLGSCRSTDYPQPEASCRAGLILRSD